MKKFLLTLLILPSLFFLTDTIFAQELTEPPSSSNLTISLSNPFNCGGDNCTLFTLLTKIINDILLPIGGILAVLSFIYSGFLYVTAQGNDTKLTKAHRALLYTSVGTAVLLGSWVIAKVIETTINQLR